MTEKYRKWADDSANEAVTAANAGDYHTARYRYGLAASFYEAAARNALSPELARAAARCWFALGACCDRLGDRAETLAEEIEGGMH